MVTERARSAGKPGHGARHFMERSSDDVRVSVPYGSGHLAVTVDDDRLAGVALPNEAEATDERETLLRALGSPLDSPSLADFVSGRERVVVLVNDATRSTPTSRILPVILPELARAGGAEFIVATGTHGPPDESELSVIFGELRDELRGRTFVHDARDSANMTAIGRDEDGEDILINSRVAGASRIVLIGSVEPHYFAGFTGGRKSILPGVASYETVERNHSHALDAGVAPMALEGNPVHEGMARAARMVGRDRIFSVTTVLDRYGRAAGAWCGDLELSFNAAVWEARRAFSVDVGERVKVVVAVATKPLDVDLYQSHKALESGKLALLDGGVIILVSECPGGVGPDAFVRTLREAERPEALLGGMRGDYRLGLHKAARIAETAARAEIWAVTGIDDATLESIFFRPFHTLQDAVDAALARSGDRARVLFLMDASMTVPNVAGVRGSGPPIRGRR
jgi:nickel-dependent lactate racemase